jgi:uncharacterized protein (DUF2132 family)
MNDEINYKTNPLHGLSLKNLLMELVDHYGFEILFAYLNINCFKTNPSVESSVKFLKKTDWAREKVEAFYLYQFKSLPKASSSQFQLPPRDRVVPEDQTPGAPAELNLEDAEKLRDQRVKSAAAYDSNKSKSYGSQRDNRQPRNRDNGDIWKDDSKSSEPSSTPSEGSVDPWAKWRK